MLLLNSLEKELGLARFVPRLFLAAHPVCLHHIYNNETVMYVRVHRLSWSSRCLLRQSKR